MMPLLIVPDSQGDGQNESMGDALLVISDREPLAWLLREQRFAIPTARMKSAPPPGTRLFLYTTRGCYRNPPRDRGQVMGVAVVQDQAGLLEEPEHFRGRDYAAGFSLQIGGVTTPHAGVELGPLAGRLDALPDPASWSVRLRRSFVPLSKRDAATIQELLEPLTRPLPEVLGSYLEACRLG
jgi:hypothetical protein